MEFLLQLHSVFRYFSMFSPLKEARNQIRNHLEHFGTTLEPMKLPPVRQGNIARVAGQRRKARLQNFLRQEVEISLCMACPIGQGLPGWQGEEGILHFLNLAK